MDAILPPPPDVDTMSRTERRDAQYRHLVEVADAVARWVRETQDAPPATSWFWSKPLPLPAAIAVDNRVPKQRPLDGITNPGVSVFRRDISEEYGYLNFFGDLRAGVYRFDRAVWYHPQYWDPAE